MNPCPGPYIWYGTVNFQGAVLLCACCGQITVTGNLNDERHAETPVMREGLA